MVVIDEGERLRQEIARGREGGRGSLPPELRRRAQAYVARRAAEGASQRELARALGLSGATIRSWCRARRAPTFHAVTVVDAPKRGEGGRLSVVTRGGLRIEGLDVASVCELVERLG